MSEESKPSVEGNAQIISIKVQADDGDEVTFKVKPTIKFDRIIGVYAKRRAIAPNLVRLIFDGNRVGPSQTPQDLGMEDGDVSWAH
jgi:small ubiquitin-related modifier